MSEQTTVIEGVRVCKSTIETVTRVRVTKAALEKALEAINTPDIKHLDRVRRRHGVDPVFTGVVIHGAVQKAYAAQTGVGASDVWTVVGEDGYGYSFNTLNQLAQAWEKTS